MNHRTGPRVADVGEFGLIRRISEILETSAGAAAADPDIAVGIGDDAAVLRSETGWDLVLTCDVQVCGRHFRPRGWARAGSGGGRWRSI